MKVAGLAEYAEMVPIEAIAPYAEYDRRPGRSESEYWNKVDQEYWDKLKAHIAEHGFEDPLTLSYNPDSGTALLDEGNHRLGVAQELGLSHVPVMVYRRSSPLPYQMHEPGTYRMENDYGHSQFPQYAKPSLIGLPVSEEPYTQAQSHWYDDLNQDRTSAWNIEKVTSEDAWFADYLKEVLSSRAPEFPAPTQKIGACQVTWEEIDPRVVRIVAKGGSIDDRSWAEGIVRDQLWHFGYHRAEVFFDFHEEDGPADGTEVGIIDIEAPGKQGPTIARLSAESAIGLDIEGMDHPSIIAAWEDEDWGEPDFDQIQQAGEIRPWSRGSLGKGLIDNDGQLHSWAVNEYGEPHHDDYAGEKNVRYHTKFDIFPNGRCAIPSPDEENLFGIERPEAEALLEEKAPEHGLKWTPQFMSSMQRKAHWTDIMSKAKRLVQSGQVTILRNGYNSIVAHVIGDHGEYNSEISRDDPNSRAITGWQCECPWDQYAWQRTRQWKKYEGRPCAHVLAAYWKSLGTPLDSDVPNDFSPTPGQRGPIPGGPPSMPPGGPPGAVVGPPQPMPGAAPAQPSLPGMQPPGAEVLPPSPMDQLAQQMNPPVPGATPAGMPAPPNSVSVPGARPPTPFGPVQYPGGTYSSAGFTEQPMELANGTVSASISYDPNLRVVEILEWWSLVRGQGNTQEALQELRQKYPGCSIVAADVVTLNAAPYWRKMRERGLIDDMTDEWGQSITSANAQFLNGNKVRLKKPTFALTEGREGATDAGQYVEIPANTQGDCLGQDPTTGWIECIFQMKGGPMTSYHARAFLEPSELTDLGPGTAFIKRAPSS